MEFLTMAAAFVIAALSGMGVGSGGLFVIYLTLLCNVPQKSAQGLNLVFFLLASGASMLIHLTRRTIPFGRVLLISAAGLLAAVPGTYAALILPEDIVRKLFGIMLVFSGAAGLLRGNTKKQMK